MVYNPSTETTIILDKAWQHIKDVPYAVTARWVFYRLLQDGDLSTKADYKRLLGYLSKARKGFYGPWRPDTLTDDTRGAILRGRGFENGGEWVKSLVEQESCYLDKWGCQPNYVELWFEAAAMEAQFEYYANENITLLAFHGDISIPEKWKAAKRIAARWANYGINVKILYCGDLDPKGIQIPETAKEDVIYFASIILEDNGYSPNDFIKMFEFIRVGINAGQEIKYNIPENPDRPNTYQWEGLNDAAASELILSANTYIDESSFLEVVKEEDRITEIFREHLRLLEL